ncbi:MAG: tetratricopeptide repeat protein, partial [Chitinophagales bacterium]
MLNPQYLIVPFCYTLLLLTLLRNTSLWAEDKKNLIIENKQNDSIEYLLDSANFITDNALFSLKLSEKLANYYYRNNQYDNALLHYLSALEAAKNLQDINKINKHYYNVGLLNTKLGDFSTAVDYFSKILEENSIEILSNQLKSDIYGELATAYLYKGDYTKSSEFQIKALRIREALKDTLGIGKSQYTFGNMYYQQQNYKEARKYYEKALETWNLNQFEDGIYRCYAALGGVYSELGEAEKSLKYNLNALKLAEKLKNLQGISYVLYNIGENYYKKEAYPTSESYYNRALNIMLELGDKNGQVILLEAIGNLQLQQNHPQESLQTLESALRLAEEIKASPRIQELYYSIAKNYDSRGNLKEAFKYKEKYIELKNTLLDEGDLELINQMQIDYNAEKIEKEKEIVALEQADKLQNIYLGFAISVITLLILAILIGIFSYQIRLKKRNLLQLEQANIDVEKEQIAYSNEDLKQFVWVVAHDLKEPLRMINSYTRLLKNALKKVITPSSTQQFEEIMTTSKKMGKLLTNLLEYSRLDKEDEILTKTDVNKVMETAIYSQYNLIQEQNIAVTTDELPTLQVFPKQFTKMLGLITQNAIKFRREDVES